MVKITPKRIKWKLCKLLAKFGLTRNWPQFWLRRCGYSIGYSTGDCYIGEELLIVDDADDEDMVIIEDRVYIAPRVTIVTATHPLHADERLSTDALRGKVVIKKKLG